MSDAEVRALLAESERTTLLRFSTAGSVDDGKSTLIGRLLHDSKNVYDDHIAALEKKAKKRGEDVLDLSLLTDGLKAEQEQGITIDVAYRYFSTPKRRFILADTPGHEQYTRNMATGASTADLTIILIDARKGVLTQTKRHSFIAALLGVPRLLVCVNKMDLVGYRQEVFDSITREYTDFAAKLNIKEIKFIPVSALKGDCIVRSSTDMSWYSGETVMEYLESVYVAGDRNQVDFRFPVQYVIRPDQNYRGYAGQIRSGSISVGEEVVALPSLRRSRVRSIDYMDSDPDQRRLSHAVAPLSVAITLEDELDVSRGDMLVRAHNVPHVRREFEAMVVWMSETPMNTSRSYIVMHTSRQTKSFVTKIHYRMNVNTLHREEGRALALNEIGRVSLATKQPLFVDPYDRNRATGNFILIDEESFQTVGAGMIIDRQPEEVFGYTGGAGERQHALNLHREDSEITRARREEQLGARAVTVWCTGLSGSGKSTLAKAFEARLFSEGRSVYRLDGDNLRFGLNKNLGFSQEDRRENIRRAAEVAKLFNDAGVSVICSLISPMQIDRDRAREIIGADSFIEVYVSTPLGECEKRDPHGLYQKARSGEIPDFTGISSPYEAPESPHLELDTSVLSVEQCIEQLLQVVSRDSL
ncbi:MAG: sulfate adenylyltransferase subunit CysN [Pseudomonadota bacterium]|jgi:bifunctional enzyme CysN/CysC